jgi:hypothetical protein
LEVTEQHIRGNSALDRSSLARMEILDRVFEILFARMRRKTGDSNLERAWRGANNRVAGYLALPFGAGAVVLVVVIYAVSGEGTRVEHRHWGQVIAWMAGVLVILLLNRRFRKYLSIPPILSVAESHADTRLVFWFRAISVGLFALTCLIGLLLHHAGFSFLQGL